MRCVACDDPLTGLEQSRKSPTTGEDYLLCTPCLREAGLLVPSIENPLADDQMDDQDPDFYDTLGNQDED